MRRLIPLLALLVLLVCAGTALAATGAKPSYVYTGRTTQGISVRLAAQSKGALRWFRYKATLTCNDGSTFTDDYFSDDVTIKKNETFSSLYSANAGAVSTRVTGKLTGRKASGTIRIVERYSQIPVNGSLPLSASGSIVCDSTTVKWTATA